MPFKEMILPSFATGETLVELQVMMLTIDALLNVQHIKLSRHKE
jgi:hypothetical protein